MATHTGDREAGESADTGYSPGRTLDIECPRCEVPLEHYKKSENVGSYRCPTEGCKPDSLWWAFKQWLAEKIPGMKTYY